jgi:hypothetical protein
MIPLSLTLMGVGTSCKTNMLERAAAIFSWSGDMKVDLVMASFGEVGFEVEAGKSVEDIRQLVYTRVFGAAFRHFRSSIPLLTENSTHVPMPCCDAAPTALFISP